MVLDESHVTVPQLGGMYEGDLSRKSTLVEHGFRLPSAIDNRPLKFEEFTERVHQTVLHVGDAQRLRDPHSKGVVEQIVRPTGLVDPEVADPADEGTGRRPDRGDPQRGPSTSSASWSPP